MDNKELDSKYEKFLSDAIDENQKFVSDMILNKVKTTQNIMVLSCFFEMLRQNAEANIIVLDEQMSETEKKISRELRTAIITNNKKVKFEINTKNEY